MFSYFLCDETCFIIALRQRRETNKFFSHKKVVRSRFQLRKMCANNDEIATPNYFSMAKKTTFHQTGATV